MEKIKLDPHVLNVSDQRSRTLGEDQLRFRTIAELPGFTGVAGHVSFSLRYTCG